MPLDRGGVARLNHALDPEHLATCRAIREEKLAELDLSIDASLTSYAQQLLAGKVKVVPADLLRPQLLAQR